MSLAQRVSPRMLRVSLILICTSAVVFLFLAWHRDSIAPDAAWRVFAPAPASAALPPSSPLAWAHKAYGDGAANGDGRAAAAAAPAPDDAFDAAAFLRALPDPAAGGDDGDPMGGVQYAFSSPAHEGNRSLRTLGQPGHFITLDAPIIDMRTGRELHEATTGGAFNLAVLKLPHRSKWGYLGIARGPTRIRPFMQVEGHNSREQSLLL